MGTEVEECLALDYPIELIPDREGGGYVARNPDLPGCVAQAETAGEVVALLDQVRRHWMEIRFEQGLPIPKPVSQEFSGKVLLRMPITLHEELAKLAKRREVSLNLLINNALSEHLGHTRAGSEFAEVAKDLRAALTPAKL